MITTQKAFAKKNFQEKMGSAIEIPEKLAKHSLFSSEEYTSWFEGISPSRQVRFLSTCRCERMSAYRKRSMLVCLCFHEENTDWLSNFGKRSFCAAGSGGKSVFSNRKTVAVLQGYGEEDSRATAILTWTSSIEVIQCSRIF